MTKLLTAIALTIALPAAANAQQAQPAPTKMECRHADKAECEKCCKDMGKMDHSKHGAMDHSKHGAMDHSQHGGAKAPAADPHKGHKN